MSLNTDLQERLQNEFEPNGIVAFTKCCRYGCTGNYGDDEDFEVRKDGGIYFIWLSLSCMNYRPLVDCVYASYDNNDYLMEHWEEECTMMKRWLLI